MKTLQIELEISDWKEMLEKAREWEYANGYQYDEDENTLIADYLTRAGGGFSIESVDAWEL